MTEFAKLINAHREQCRLADYHVGGMREADHVKRASVLWGEIRRRFPEHVARVERNNERLRLRDQAIREGRDPREYDAQFVEAQMMENAA